MYSYTSMFSMEEANNSFDTGGKSQQIARFPFQARVPVCTCKGGEGQEDDYSSTGGSMFNCLESD